MASPCDWLQIQYKRVVYMHPRCIPSFFLCLVLTQIAYSAIQTLKTDAITATTIALLLDKSQCVCSVYALAFSPPCNLCTQAKMPHFTYL